MKEKREKEVELKISEGGFEYIETESGLRIRNSYRADRIKEDNETYEEYQMRRKLAQNAEKRALAPTLVWDSKRLGSYTPEREARLRELLKLNKEEDGK